MTKISKELEEALLACRAARDVLDDMRSQQDTVEPAIAQVRLERDRCEKELSIVVIENETMARLGRPLASTESLNDALRVAEDGLKQAEAKRLGFAEVIEKARADLDAKHEALGAALRIETGDLRALAAQKYQVALTALRDALLIVEKLDDRHFGRSVQIPDILGEMHAWSKAQPSPSVTVALDRLRPHLHERSITMARLTRV